MQISERIEGSILVLSVEGRLDNNGSDLFRERALAHIRAGVRSIIVDFGGTTFIASMGIRALFIPTQELSKLKGRIVLAGLSPDIKTLFVTAGLLDLFQVHPTVEVALADKKWKA